jgi:ABC-type sugar transport system ATPase subunit
MPIKTVLEMRHIRKVFPGVVVLVEVLVLLGENGAGKSTFFLSLSQYSRWLSPFT